MKIFLLAGLVIAFAVSACRAGHEFTRTTPESLILGKTSYQEILQKNGPPFSETPATVNDRPVKTVVYFHSVGRVSGGAYYEGVTPDKTMTYFFWEDRLVGYRFTSSFKEDNTDFDDSKIAGIKQGETTRAQVVALLGAPHGVHVYPLTKDPRGSGLVYAYSHGRYVRTGLGTFTNVIFRKILTIRLDPNDVVAEVNFVTSGEK